MGVGGVGRDWELGQRDWGDREWGELRKEKGNRLRTYLPAREGWPERREDMAKRTMKRDKTTRVLSSAVLVLTMD